MRIYVVTRTRGDYTVVVGVRLCGTSAEQLMDMARRDNDLGNLDIEEHDTKDGPK